MFCKKLGCIILTSQTSMGISMLKNQKKTQLANGPKVFDQSRDENQKTRWMFPKIGGKLPKWMVKIMENPIF